MQWSYSVNTAGVPAWAVAAITPTAPRSPASLLWGDSRIHGNPGTREVSTPKPGFPPVDPQQPLIQPSYCAPDHIRPSQYWNEITSDWFYTPVAETGNEVEPTPSAALYYVGGIAAQRARMGGQYQVAMPQPAQSFPNLLTGSAPSGNGVTSRFGGNPLAGGGS
jgi:hypothetical protein